MVVILNWFIGEEEQLVDVARSCTGRHDFSILESSAAAAE